MPTVSRLDGLRVVIYPNDHRPAHVHVMGPDGEAVFILNCPDGPPELRENYGFKWNTARAIASEIGAILATLCQAWREIHGDY